MDCGHECFMIGGPYIAENPDCPVHGSGCGELRDRIRDIVGLAVFREISVDQAVDDIMTELA